MKLPAPFKRTRSVRLLQVSAVMTLLAIALMFWALLQPTPLPVMLAMSAGQGLGTLALATYVFVIVRDLRRGRAARSAPIKKLALAPDDGSPIRSLVAATDASVIEEPPAPPPPAPPPDDDKATP